MADQSQVAEATARSAVTEAFLESGGAPVAIAVSGGGDSLALLTMAAQVRGSVPLHAVTVNHGLREEALDEAALVARHCAELSVAHETLNWEITGARKNLQAAARDARRHLIADWARARGISHVWLAHTAGDQAETILQRLSRGSGVDGLAAMARTTHWGGIAWHRPLLGVERSTLREILERHGIAWCDDPSNDDITYQRVRMRRYLADPDCLFDANRLAATAAHMARAAEVLDAEAARLASRAVTWSGFGAISINVSMFLEALAETRSRLLADCLCAVAGAVYRPRFADLERLLTRVCDGQGFGMTLHGCQIARHDDHVHLSRELGAVPDQTPGFDGMLWDGRWRLIGPVPMIGAWEVRPAGVEGSRASELGAVTSPAIWQDGVCVGRPLLDAGAKIKAQFELTDARRRGILMSR